LIAVSDGFYAYLTTSGAAFAEGGDRSPCTASSGC